MLQVWKKGSFLPFFGFRIVFRVGVRIAGKRETNSKLQVVCFRRVARNLQWGGGCYGSHGRRTTEEKGIHVDLKQFFHRNSGEDQNKRRRKKCS